MGQTILRRHLCAKCCFWAEHDQAQLSVLSWNVPRRAVVSFLAYWPLPWWLQPRLGCWKGKAFYKQLEESTLWLWHLLWLGGVSRYYFLYFLSIPLDLKIKHADSFTVPRVGFTDIAAIYDERSVEVWSVLWTCYEMLHALYAFFLGHNWCSISTSH